MAEVEITMEEIGQAHEWLANNTDKWENWGGFRFLVPKEEIPEVVVRCVEFEDRSAKTFMEQLDLLEKMGII